MSEKQEGAIQKESTPNLKSYCKDTQIPTVYKAFATETPKTMLQVSIETGILRANICRYNSKFVKQDRMQLVKKGICPISKHRAGFYTTNKELFVNDSQLSLF